jgi:hypothetical protein
MTGAMFAPQLAELRGTHRCMSSALESGYGCNAKPSEEDGGACNMGICPHMNVTRQWYRSSGNERLPTE